MSAASAFQSGRAAIVSMVSKTCGCSSWRGMLCALAPAAITADGGAPGDVSRVNARAVLAATPGRSS